MSAKSVYVTMIKVSTLKKNPQNPRQIKGERLELLKRSITEFEKMMPLQPIVVDETNTVLSGNMRLAAIKALGLKEIPDGWVKQADDLTEDEKRRLVITANSSFGEYDWDILANEWTDAPLADWGLDIPGFDAVDVDGTKTEDVYSQKIGAPIYQITGEEPSVSDLLNNEKTENLIQEITASEIPDAVKGFLVQAAQRHLVFSYEKIAEFYAHADAPTQELMEKSALVIIDFDKAIEYGYVQLTREIEDIYREEYP